MFDAVVTVEELCTIGGAEDGCEVEKFDCILVLRGRGVCCAADAKLRDVCVLDTGNVCPGCEKFCIGCCKSVAFACD